MHGRDVTRHATLRRGVRQPSPAAARSAWRGADELARTLERSKDDGLGTNPRRWPCRLACSSGNAARRTKPGVPYGSIARVFLLSRCRNGGRAVRSIRLTTRPASARASRLPCASGSMQTALTRHDQTGLSSWGDSAAGRGRARPCCLLRASSLRAGCAACLPQTERRLRSLPHDRIGAPLEATCGRPESVDAKSQIGQFQTVTL